MAKPSESVQNGTEKVPEERRLQDLRYLREMIEAEERSKSQVADQPAQDAPDVLK